MNTHSPGQPAPDGLPASVRNKIDTTVAHPARRYNYWLGGKDNYAADRESADAIEKIFSGIRTAAVENRRFLHRAVRTLTQDFGIDQFLDIGTGMPTADNTHEVAQRINPAARIVYVDNDPLVLVHARALLTSDPAGATAYIDADLRDTQQILHDAERADTLDLTKPVGLFLVAILHFLPDTDQAYAVVRTLMDRLAPGSFLVLSHATVDLLPDLTGRQLTSGDVPGIGNFTPRSRAQIDGFFDGLEKLPPGLEIVSAWRPEPGTELPSADQVSMYGAVARKSP